MNERFQLSLQQDLMTLIVHDDKHGRAITKIIDPNLFEGDYRVIVERAVQFWADHDTAPKQHIADLFSDIFEDRHDRRGNTYKHILVSMEEVKDKINVDYVLRSMNLFIMEQRTRATIIESAEKLDAGGVNALPHVHSLLRDFLNEQKTSLDPGLRLDEIDKILEYLRASSTEFDTGIREFDESNIVPMRGKIWLLIAPAKRGKTWSLVQLGKRAFMRRKKVLHVTLEIEEEEVAQRYYQALFGISKREDLNRISRFRFDDRGRLDQIITESVEVPFTFSSNAVREELLTRVAHFGLRASNILIKRFPMSSLTLNQLEGYLESLATIEEFEPDLVLVDYPKIMKLDAKNIRTSLGLLFEGLRGLSQRRNFAVGAVHQGNRASDSADLVKGSHVAEDWSIIGTCDFVITYSQTAAERRLNLARLFVDAARSEQDKFGVLVTQSYKTGQFVLDSTRLSDAYARIIEQMQPDEDDEPEDDDG